MVNLKTLLDTRRQKSDGSFNIIFRITHNRKVYTLNSGFQTLELYWNDKRKGLNKICFIGGITLLVNYFYYMLSPKTDYMILHLNEENQREKWLNIHKTMQFKYHIGLLLGIIASMVLAYAVKC